METKFRFYNLGNFFGVGKIESHIGKSRVEHTSTDIIHFTSLTGRTRVFGIQTCQCSEARLSSCDTVGIVAQLFFDTVDFFLCCLRLACDDFHFHLHRYDRQTIFGNLREILSHVARRHIDVLHQFLFHLGNHLLVLEVIAHLLAHLRHRLIAILFQFLLRACH